MKGAPPPDLRNSEPEGMESVSQNMADWVSELSERHGVVHLGGFSQGAMLACDVVFCQSVRPASLLLLSGTLVAEKRWTAALGSRPLVRFPVFQSHGEVDPLLGFIQALGLRQFLEERGFAVEFHRFHGGHEIPPPVLTALRTFLKTQGC